MKASSALSTPSGKQAVAAAAAAHPREAKEARLKGRRERAAKKREEHKAKKEAAAAAAPSYCSWAITLCVVGELVTFALCNYYDCPHTLLAVFAFDSVIIYLSIWAYLERDLRLR
jgi:hypothetical protein